MNTYLYDLITHLVEILFNERIQSVPETVFLEKPSEISDPEPVLKINLPYDYKILIVAADKTSAANYANGLMLEDHHWVYVDSTQEIHYYNQKQCEIHLAGKWFKSSRVHTLLQWASKEEYTII